ncbi:uncharacterized protein LOC111803699 [Cucurbita pepo subsp. pepo]|uniref:uncharacterized protein LOC111803699 n=1 Tax=Cucurbita pepo subsp. pepo TaxID=3664 RepID=UPI000C9D60C3|nr:uncharacterized protein LOC111803699 [Cucurbita pepo subsp. pepo]
MEIKNGHQMKKSNKENKLSQLIKASSRLLSKVRDFYVRSLTDCSNHLDYGMAMTGPTSQVPTTLPKSYSVGSTASSHGSDDFRELLRAASTRSLSKNLEPDIQIQAARKSPMAELKNVPRSQSVGIGRIDEEKTCEFEEDFKVCNTDAYPRSRSYAVHRRRRVY